jgi:KDO2-lipid IV(A) lauroyltransferase
LRILELLPYAVQRCVGSGIGLLIRHLPLAYTRIARRNIELCFPGFSPADRAALLKRHCQSLGVGMCEIATTWWGSDESVRRLAKVEGIEHLVGALAKGRGAILVGGHFTTIEIATRILGTVVPLNVVYRPTKNALLARVMCKRFFRHGRPIAHDDVRSMIRALKHNEAVWYAPDQSYRNKGAVMADFFAIPAATSTATSRLARISGAAVLTYFPERLPGNAGYRVHIGPELQGYPSGSDMHDVNRFNALLQAQILKVPEQYLWMHRRFKGLSADYPDYYGRDTRRRSAVGMNPPSRGRAT